jgi:DNA-binding PadR family transcriptional regulator
MSIRYALLALLSSGPKHGFQLAHDFEAGTGEMWPLNTGQVYTTLQRLERDGLVDANDDADGPQNVFHLTDAGRDELGDWLRTPPDLTTPPRDELVIKLLVALRVPGIDPAELTQIHRRHLIETMHEYTRLKEDANERDIGLLLVADAEIFRLEAMVRWLDAADARIKRLPTPLTEELQQTAPRRPLRRASKIGARR